MFQENQVASQDKQHLTLRQLTNNLIGKKGAHILYMFSEYEKYMEHGFSYISDGLDNGDKILLIEDQNFYVTVTEKLLKEGYSEEGIKSIIYTDNVDYYGLENEFSSENTLEKLMGFLNVNIVKDVRTRIWGHVLTQGRSVSELRKYENECDKIINGENIVSVCSYNALTVPAFLQNEMLKVHEYLMMDNQLEKSPFYSRNYLKGFSDLEMERLQNLEKENYLLKKKNDELLTNQTRQKEREKYLQLAKVNAEKANKAKSVFLSQMSHDLRTPLNTIQGYSQIIEMSESNPDIKRKISKIYHASEQLLKLIEEILDFTTLDSGSLNINKEEVVLKPFLEYCVESLLDINDTDILIVLEEIDDAMYVEVDPYRFNQIITNLLNNAIKYNKPNGTITINCKYNKHSENIDIRIKDTGIGIENDEKELIFEPFYRSKSTMNNWEGTGLGLAIVAQLTKRMNGKYGVMTEAGNGSTFWVSFKGGEAKSSSEHQDTDVKGESSNLSSTVKVLYIEDNNENISVMQSMLDLMGNIDLTCAPTGKSGINKAFEGHPHLILLDFSLPDINGYQVLNKLKSNPVTKDIPIVAVSADAMESTIKRALIEGCAAYVTKPINYEELKRVFGKVMTHSIL